MALPRFKAGALDFMRASTELTAAGTWQDPDSVSNDERADNVLLEVQFGEIADELVGAGIVARAPADQQPRGQRAGALRPDDQHRGDDADRLSAATAAWALPGGRHRPQPVELPVRPGEQAPGLGRAGAGVRDREPGSGHCEQPHRQRVVPGTSPLVAGSAASTRPLWNATSPRGRTGEEPLLARPPTASASSRECARGASTRTGSRAVTAAAVTVGHLEGDACRPGQVEVNAKRFRSSAETTRTEPPSPRGGAGRGAPRPWARGPQRE